MKTERPLRKRDVRTLHYAAYGDRESLLTRIAVQQARAMALAIQAINLFARRNADRTVHRASPAFRSVRGLYLRLGKWGSLDRLRTRVTPLV